MSKKLIKKSQNLKFLQTKLSKLQSQREILLKEVNEKQKGLTTLNKEIKTIQANLDDLKENSNDLIFSEHSILRYIERVMGIDMEALKEKILPKDERLKILKTSKSLTYKKDGLSFKIKDGVILTIANDEIAD